ncbi:MAG: hypothetical protein ACRDYC_10475, partial [Acidimicrobiales bacterium]
DPETQALLERAGWGGDAGDGEGDGAEPGGAAGKGGGEPGRERKRRILTARREGELVGVAFLTPSAATCDLSVTVDPAFLGAGVGEHLAAAARSAATSAGWIPPTPAAAWEAGRAADVRRSPATG